MFIIPVQINETDFLALVVLKADNVKRIMQYDPAEVMPSKMGAPWNTLRLTEVHITYATDKEEMAAIARCKGGDVKGAMKLLTRGFKFRPDQGDHDGPAERLL
jgi:hypothetical protein